MEYRNLGNSGLRVSQFGLGCNNFGPRIDEKTSASVINHALDVGINFLDGADVYGKGTSEEYIGRAIKTRRSQVIISSKCGYPMGDKPNEAGTSRYHIIRSVEASLRRFQTDYIDLYFAHIPDPNTPIEETLRALDDLVRAGKIRYIGCSNFAGWQLCEALWTSKVNSLNSFVIVESNYNIIQREIERELVGCCKAYDIGVIPWGPLAGGFLTGEYEKSPNPFYDHVFAREENWKRLAALKALASEIGHPVSELAIAWLLSKPWISTIIIGAMKPEQITANLAAAEWKLTDEEAAKVDAISKPDK